MPGEGQPQKLEAAKGCTSLPQEETAPKPARACGNTAVVAALAKTIRAL